MKDLPARIELTSAVRDSDRIPKVDGAGSVRIADGQRVQVMHNGIVVEADCYCGAWMTEVIERLGGHHEPQEEVVFHEVVERLSRDTPGAIMMELGCYWAYYSLWFKRAVPDATTVIVEPSSEHLEIGLRNFRLNGESALAKRAAVGIPYDEVGETEPTPLLTVEALMDLHDLPRIDVLHCDTQGAEVPMLEESGDLLRSGRVRFVFISTHHHSTTGDPLTHQRCVQMLKDYGGHIIAEHSVSESCSADGLVVASMDPRDRDMHVPVSFVRSRDTLFGEVEYELAEAMTRPSNISVLRGTRRIASRLLTVVGKR